MSSWKSELAHNITSLQEAVAFCRISTGDQTRLLDHTPFSISLPRRLAEKMEKGNVDDPIFRQFVPLLEEEQSIPGFCLDPLEEVLSRPCPNLLHKYPGRALLLVTKACGMHCRFCFRRHFPHTGEAKDFSEELAYLQAHPEIEEVILSGGDPLALPNEALGKLLIHLEKISHIQRIRFHTRFPLGFPERIDDQFINLLCSVRPKILFVLHVNHPKELDNDVKSALRRLSSSNILLLSQTVLLRGVNDSIDVLETLMKELFSAGIVPYYLHQLDRVLGTHHFEVPISKGIALLKQLQDRLPGYMVPRYVQERPGEKGKSLITQLAHLEI